MATLPAVINLKTVAAMNRKALQITDISTNFWGTTGFTLSDFVFGNPQGFKVELRVIIETLDKTYDKLLNLTELGAFGAVGYPKTQEQLTFNLGINSADEIVYMDSVNNIPATNKEFPDGVYTLDYTITNVAPTTKTINFVITARADLVIETKAMKLSQVLVSGDAINPFVIVDYLLYEALLYAVSKSSFVGRRESINKLLNLINNESYEYNTNQ